MKPNSKKAPKAKNPKKKKHNREGRPFKFELPTFKKRVEEYFASCWTQKIDMFGNPVYVKDKKGKKTDVCVMVQSKPYTVSGLAVFLGTSRETLMDYQAKDEFSDTIKEAKQKIFSYAEEFLFSGKNPTGAIFNLKNNWKWQDKSEIDHTTKGKKIVGFNFLPPAKPTDDGDNTDNQTDV